MGLAWQKEAIPILESVRCHTAAYTAEKEPHGWDREQARYYSSQPNGMEDNNRSDLHVGELSQSRGQPSRERLTSTEPSMPEHLETLGDHDRHRDVIISFRITRSLADRIESYRQRQRGRPTKTQAVTYLLETALFVMENAANLNSPDTVKYFRENLYNIQLVDDIMQWPQDRIEAIIGALASEKERRFRIRIGKL